MEATAPAAAFERRGVPKYHCNSQSVASASASAPASAFIMSAPNPILYQLLVCFVCENQKPPVASRIQHALADQNPSQINNFGPAPVNGIFFLNFRWMHFWFDIQISNRNLPKWVWTVCANFDVNIAMERSSYKVFFIRINNVVDRVWFTISFLLFIIWSISIKFTVFKFNTNFNSNLE